ncbi:pyridoxamine 5'-phosphate oxidase family protein [Candidatus Parcubacteria bacterium]|nr:pyridoxamine 5'-phosphate oxidase family protein [Candidatus Parcubacteria bacterium]
MKTIAPEALEYLKTQRVGTLAVEMLDGSPHAATVHFAHTEEPLAFYIQTGTDCRKSEALLKNGSTRASFVVGSDESNMKTLQLDGVAKVANEGEEDHFMEIYLGKFPSKEGKVKDPEALFIIFTPTWWRFTDWKTAEGKKIWISE